jgi:hypothetical protein
MGWAGIVAPIGNLKDIYKVTGKKSWREDGLEDLDADGILKWILKYKSGPLAGSYEHGNEFSVSIRGREI